jgi:hypothetical protein
VGDTTFPQLHRQMEVEWLALAKKIAALWTHSTVRFNCGNLIVPPSSILSGGGECIRLPFSPSGTTHDF